MRFTLIILLLQFSLKAIAQSFAVYNYSVSEGLPSSEVYQIYQDKKGFLWFATDNGVAKFDGLKTEIFNLSDGLSDPVTFGFYEDVQGRLWFRSYSGKLSYHQNGKITRYFYSEKYLAENRYKHRLVPYSIYCSPTSEIWISGRHFIGKINKIGEFIPYVFEDNSVVYKSIEDTYLVAAIALSTDPVKNLIIDNKKFKIHLTNKITYNNQVCVAKWRNKLYLSINRDIFRYDTTTVKRIYTGPSHIISLSNDKEDNLWIGYLGHGAERHSNENFREIWNPRFLISKSVTSVLQDDENGLWFATLENGIYHAPNLLIEKIPLTSKIKSVASNNKNVFIGDSSGDIYVFDSESKKIINTRNFDSPIYSLFADEKDKIWFGFDRKTFWTTSKLEVTQVSDLFPLSFSKDVTGNLWVYGGNILRQLDPLGKQLKRKSLDVIYRSIFAHDSLLYMACRIGMHIRDYNLRIIDAPTELSSYRISNFLSLNDSNILITTIGGGFFIYNKKLSHYESFHAKKNFLTDNIYSALIVDSTLWFGTDKGIAITSLRELLQSKPQFNFLTKRNGLVDNKIDFLTESNRSVWAFADQGISIIPYTFSKFSNKQPTFYFKEISVNNKPIPPQNHFNLRHNENNIHLAFGFISFSNQNILVRYRLSKNDPWTMTSATNLLFPALSPGTYHFNLQYSTDNIHWTSASLLNITISQPWWNKWYTYLALVIISLTLGYFYFRYQQSIYRQRNHFLKIINEHQQKLIQSEISTRERERNRISKELHDRVGTNLTAIKLTVNQLLQHHSDPLTHEIEEQFQIAIGEIKDIIYGLTPPGLERYGLFAGLKNYVHKLTRAIPVNIDLKTYGKDNCSYELNILVFRVLQELITNTIKHAHAKNITIHINAFDDMLSIVYEDNGIGFSYDPEKRGLGLDNIESRIQSVNGTLKFESGSFGVSYTIDIPFINHQAGI